jgi:hypothetical protein
LFYIENAIDDIEKIRDIKVEIIWYMELIDSLEKLQAILDKCTKDNLSAKEIRDTARALI